MGSGSLRELLVLKKIAFGGVYVTDPVVPTFCEPKLTAWGQKCVTVDEDDDHEDDDHEDDDHEDRRRRGPTTRPGSWALARCVSFTF